jgi:hypothetical protein
MSPIYSRLQPLFDVKLVDTDTFIIRTIGMLRYLVYICLYCVAACACYKAAAFKKICHCHFLRL